jgi:hypothetical protein
MTLSSYIFQLFDAVTEEFIFASTTSPVTGREPQQAIVTRLLTNCLRSVRTIVRRTNSTTSMPKHTQGIRLGLGQCPADHTSTTCFVRSPAITIGNCWSMCVNIAMYQPM